jgi:hypothetical protein
MPKSIAVKALLPKAAFAAPIHGSGRLSPKVSPMTFNFPFGSKMAQKEFF